MPRRSILQQSFVDAFLLRMKKRDRLLNRKILLFNLESLLLHGNEDFREQILDREKKGEKAENLRTYGTKRKSDCSQT